MVHVVAASIKFSPGDVVMTPGAQEAFENNKQAMLPYLLKHLTGEWGDLCEDDKQANEAALKYHTRILSAYHLTDGTKIWIITEADRSSTCALLPDEY